MKHITLLFALLYSSLTFAQVDVELEIKHMLGNETFSFNTTKKTNTGADFNVQRLEYYIAEIVLEHDGGTMTPVSDFWILADASQDMTYQLGSFNITNLEAIHFGIGVEESYNHKDPATYPASHPLAPKSPSMHWGWGPGYRFLALEGKKGSGVSETYELHCLGDDYYFTQRIPTNGADASGKLLITLNGDYTKILENMDMSGVVVDHGELPKNILALENMFNYVFTSGEGNRNSNSTVTGISENNATAGLIAYPNPSNGLFNINIDQKANYTYRLEIYDLQGRLLEQESLGSQSGPRALTTELKGMFLCRVLDGNMIVQNFHLVITK